jgi:hypothetical protein
VTVTYDYKMLVIGQLLKILGPGTFTNPIRLSATAAMINE